MRALKELARSYVTISKDRVRVMTRVKGVVSKLGDCLPWKTDLVWSKNSDVLKWREFLPVLGCVSTSLPQASVA